MNKKDADLYRTIYQEADHILYDKGLIELLKKYGTPHISGSYDLDLMTWRDLDLYLEADTISESRFFELGKELEDLLHPVKMSYRNERGAIHKQLPVGLYWGVYLGNEKAGAWKIDIWSIDSIELKKRIDYCETIKGKLNPVNREIIKKIKTRCWQHPGYRKSFGSSTIYEAVIDKGITSIDEFEVYLSNIFRT